MDCKYFLNFLTRYGVEIEINSFEDAENLEPPSGIYHAANLIQKSIGDKVLVSKWMNNHNNSCWIVKPDSSCGIEICSPVIKGKKGLKSVGEVIKSLSEDKKIKADSRCSLHVHFDVSKFSLYEINSIISWWIKCELIFMDAMPLKRKINQYCRLIALTDVITDVAEFVPVEELIKRLGTSKYYSFNTFHFYNQRRPTIEFRIMDNLSCLDAVSAVNWVAFLMHFIDCSVKQGVPQPYQEKNAFSGYCWLDPNDLFKFLKLDCNNICDDLFRIKKWFILRLIENSCDLKEIGIFSKTFRNLAYSQIKKMEDVYKSC